MQDLFQVTVKHSVEIGNAATELCFVEPEEFFGGANIDVDHFGADFTG